MDSTKSRALEEALRKDFVHDRLPLDIGAVASAKLARLATPRSNRNEKVPQFTADPSTIHIETPVILARSALDILAGEDLKRLLQGLDLGLATRDALFVAHARINAARLQLVVVRQRRVQLPLRALEVFLGHLQLGVLPRLELLLVVGLRSHRRLVHAAVRHEGLVLRGGAVLLRRGLALEAREVRSDHLEHADNAATLGPHALVARVEGPRRVLHGGAGEHWRSAA